MLSLVHWTDSFCVEIIGVGSVSKSLENALSHDTQGRYLKSLVHCPDFCTAFASRKVRYFNFFQVIDLLSVLMQPMMR